MARSKVNYILKNIEAGLKLYPNLYKVQRSGPIAVSGEIPIKHPEKGEIDRYEVMINFPRAFPKCFPKVIETSKKIERTPARHINSDNTLCLAVLPEELAISKNGISFKYFLERVLVPHLARETFREIKGFYPDGEYAHGNDGIWEYYGTILNKSDRYQILEELTTIASSLMPRRNQICLCGSQIKFKNCHLHKYNDILKPGTKNLGVIINTLKQHLDETN